MEYKFLGGSGLRVSRICLGTMTFGNPKGMTTSLLSTGFLHHVVLDGKRLSTEAESHAILDRFVELGGNFIDTADVYNGGESEAFIGTWLAKMGEEYREKLVLATKTRFGVYPDDPHNGGGLSRKHIMRGVKDSLKRLQVRCLSIVKFLCACRLRLTLMPGDPPICKAVSVRRSA
jgi:aryl-alcohol dehydrogenase-like predicted oxidoreductase